MITTLNINNLSDLKNGFITKIVKDMFSNYGEIEITIKPKVAVLNKELISRIESVENGEKLLCFNETEFEQLNKNLLSGKKADKSLINKAKKNEKINIISE